MRRDWFELWMACLADTAQFWAGAYASYSVERRLEVRAEVSALPAGVIDLSAERAKRRRAGLGVV